MLTVADDTLRQLAEDHGKQVATHLYGQDINAETYAICKADLMLKGEGEEADGIVGGPEHSTLSNDAFPSPEHSQSGNQFFGIHASNNGKIMIFAGGVPLKKDGQVVGAVGVSGGSGEQDHAVAEAAAAAF